jgi:S-adenosylmethionine:tRNA ribosyltransferase-isomerase
MRVDDLDYPFDPALVAREPAEPRDAARLLVVDRAAGTLAHRQVRDLPAYLRPGDAVVVNETTVAPARIKAVRQGGGGAARIEGLLLERRDDRSWKALLRNGRRLRDGERLGLLPPGSTEPGPDGLTVVARDEEGWLVRFDEPSDVVLERVGWTPLPPYILKARRDDGEADDAAHDRVDRTRYQTVYARGTERPSVAAPTAGLHFTPGLLAALAERGVERIPVELQVGAGTFKPVETATLAEHPMHREWCGIGADAARALRAADGRRRHGGGRIFAVGTTSVRTLESLPCDLAALPDRPLAWETSILIAPGHRWRAVDALLTNFHLPRSTLLALVAAFIGPSWRETYAVATRERYRFYSFGDAMLVL